MAGTAVEYANVHAGASASGKAVKEVVHKFRLQITHEGVRT
jgi:hypothetical protein